MSDTQARLETLLREFAAVRSDYPFTPETKLADDLGLDSLDRLQFALDIEDEFGVGMTDEEVDRPENGTVGGLSAFIDGRLGG